MVDLQSSFPQTELPADSMATPRPGFLPILLQLLGFTSWSAASIPVPENKRCPKCSGNHTKPCVVSYAEGFTEEKVAKDYSGISNGQPVAGTTTYWQTRLTRLGKAASPPWIPVYRFVSTRRFFASFQIPFLIIAFGAFGHGFEATSYFAAHWWMPILLWPVYWWDALFSLGAWIGGWTALALPFVTWPLFLLLFNGMHFSIFLFFDRVLSAALGRRHYWQRRTAWINAWICSDCYTRWIPVPRNLSATD